MKYSIREDVLWKIVDSEAVIVDPEKEEYCYLNPTGTEIWLLLEEEKNTEEISEELAKKYGISSELIKKDIDAIISQLEQRNIIKGVSNGV